MAMAHVVEDVVRSCSAVLRRVKDGREVAEGAGNSHLLLNTDKTSETVIDFRRKS